MTAVLRLGPQQVHMAIDNHNATLHLVLHDTIYLEAAGHTTRALLIGDGRILAVGQEAIARGSQEGARAHRPEGACVMPALTDAHAHPWGLAQRAGVVDLSAARSTQDIYEALRHATTSPNGWIVGARWDQHNWQDAQALSLEQLDALWPDTPALLYRTDYHAVWCNSCALRRAGYDPQTIEASGGLLVDEHMTRAIGALGPTTVEDDRQTLARHAQRLRRMGVGCVHQAFMRVRDVAWLEAWRAQGELPLRIYGMVDAHDPDLPTLLERGPHHDPHARLSVRTIKFFADGALGSQGALLHEPYLGTNQRGQETTSADELRARIPKLAQAGWQVACHAIGDRAATHVLDAYAACAPAARHATRPRLEHAQMMRPADIARMKTLGVIPSIQPIHFYSDMPWVDQHLSASQRALLYRWSDLRGGAPLCGGSDFPIDDPNPWHAMATALTRRASDAKVYDPSQALGRWEVLEAYTSGAAWAAHWEGQLGHLRVGACADWIALSDDPFDCSEDALWDMKVVDASWGQAPRRA